VNPQTQLGKQFFSIGSRRQQLAAEQLEPSQHSSRFLAPKFVRTWRNPGKIGQLNVRSKTEAKKQHQIEVMF
jgi:hypothetical protein